MSRIVAVNVTAWVAPRLAEYYTRHAGREPKGSSSRWTNPRRAGQEGHPTCGLKDLDNLGHHAHVLTTWVGSCRTHKREQQERVEMAPLAVLLLNRGADWGGSFIVVGNERCQHTGIRCALRVYRVRQAACDRKLRGARRQGYGALPSTSPRRSLPHHQSCMTSWPCRWPLLAGYGPRT